MIFFIAGWVTVNAFRELPGLLRILDHCDGRRRPAHDPLHFRVIRVSDDHDPVPGRAVFFDDPVNPLYKRAGRIHTLGAGRAQLFVFFPGDPVGAGNDRPSPDVRELVVGCDHPHASSLQIRYDFLVVNDGAVRIDRAALLHFFIYGFHCAFYAEAETRALCSNDLSHIR